MLSEDTLKGEQGPGSGKGVASGEGWLQPDSALQGALRQKFLPDFVLPWGNRARLLFSIPVSHWVPTAENRLRKI